MIKDRKLKDILYKHFRARGWLAQIEVPVLHQSGVSAKAPPITDIDVFGIRPTPDLRWQFVLGDCKTKKNESPVNRVLWLRGLRETVGASSAILLLQRQTGNWINRDHKLAAEQQGVLLLQEQEFFAYDRAVIYPVGSSSYPESCTALETIRDDVSRRFPNLKALATWAVSSAWSVSDHMILLRRAIAELSDNRGELDPRRDDHLALILEAGVVFSVGFASLVGTVFRRYVRPDSRSDLDEAVRVIVWGGREQYDFFERLRQLNKHTDLDESNRLALPEWGRFLELTRAFLDSPRYAFRVPQLLRRLSSGLVTSTLDDGLQAERDKTLIHFALRELEYLCTSAALPTDAKQRIRDILLGRMSQLAAARMPANDPKVYSGVSDQAHGDNGVFEPAPMSAQPEAGDDAETATTATHPEDASNLSQFTPTHQMATWHESPADLVQGCATTDDGSNTTERS